MAFGFLEVGGESSDVIRLAAIDGLGIAFGAADGLGNAFGAADGFAFARAGALDALIFLTVNGNPSVLGRFGTVSIGKGWSGFAGLGSSGFLIKLLLRVLALGIFIGSPASAAAAAAGGRSFIAVLCLLRGGVLLWAIL